MLDPPPRTLPIFIGIERPLRLGLGWATKPQSRSLPRFKAHWTDSTTIGTSSLPPASKSRTLPSGFSASRLVTTEPELHEHPTLNTYDSFSPSEPYHCSHTTH